MRANHSFAKHQCEGGGLSSLVPFESQLFWRRVRRTWRVSCELGHLNFPKTIGFLLFFIIVYYHCIVLLFQLFFIIAIRKLFRLRREYAAWGGGGRAETGIAEYYSRLGTYANRFKDTFVIFYKSIIEYIFIYYILYIYIIFFIYYTQCQNQQYGT